MSPYKCKFILIDSEKQLQRGLLSIVTAHYKGCFFFTLFSKMKISSGFILTLIQFLTSPRTLNFDQRLQHNS